LRETPGGQRLEQTLVLCHEVLERVDQALAGLGDRRYVVAVDGQP
jgi:hypothetical protein